jgi:hypothetical protein
MLAGIYLSIHPNVSLRRSGVDQSGNLIPGELENLVLIFAFMISYSFIHLVSWANIRYRLPVDAFLIIFAAYAINRMFAWWNIKKRLA